MSSVRSPDVHRGRLVVPDATLHYEVRGCGPLVVLHAAPMDGRAFEALADHLADDCTILTSDPRGIARSTVEDRSAPTTPEQRADDLARLIAHVDAGPALVLGSSGGAVSALALAQAHPRLLRGVIAHEPPLIELLDNRDELRLATAAMIATFTEGDRVGYWRHFLHMAGIAMPEDVFETVFGQRPTGRAAEDERYAVEQMEYATSVWQPDLGALRDSAVPLTIGIGEESNGQLCDRTSRALAGALGLEPWIFPGDHTGFIDAPEPFGDVLRRILDGLR